MHHHESAIRSDQISHSVMSDSLRPHESQHTRPPCPSPTPGVHWDSRPSSQWCHPAISSSVIPFSSCPQSLPASESFPMSQLFAWGGQSTGVSALTSFLPKKSQGWCPSESAIGIHMSHPSWTSFPTPIPSDPTRLSQSTGLSSLYYTATSHQLSVSHMFMYIFQCYSCNSSPPTPRCCVPKSVLCIWVSVETALSYTSQRLLYTFLPETLSSRADVFYVDAELCDGFI